MTLGIDFKGGSLLEVQFAGTRPSADEIRSHLSSNFPAPMSNISDPIVQPLGEDSFSIRSKTMDDATKGRIVAAMRNPLRLAR